MLSCCLSRDVNAWETGCRNVNMVHTTRTNLFAETLPAIFHSGDWAASTLESASESVFFFLRWQIHKLPWMHLIMHVIVFHSQNTFRRFQCQNCLITEFFNIAVHKFQQWERPLRAKLETQLWLPSLVRFIKIYETANIWISGVLVFFQHLDSQTDSRCSWICSWRGRADVSLQNLITFSVRKETLMWTEHSPPSVFLMCPFPFYLSATFDQELMWEVHLWPVLEH